MKIEKKYFLSTNWKHIRLKINLFNLEKNIVISIKDDLMARAEVVELPLVKKQLVK